MSYSISTLLKRNLQDVFGENDTVRRRAAINEIFAEDCVFYDPNGGVYRDRDEIDRIAGAIKGTHPDFRYQPIAASKQCWPFSGHDKPYQISSSRICNRTGSGTFIGRGRTLSIGNGRARPEQLRQRTYSKSCHDQRLLRSEDGRLSLHRHRPASSSIQPPRSFRPDPPPAESARVNAEPSFWADYAAVLSASYHQSRPYGLQFGLQLIWRGWCTTCS